MSKIQHISISEATQFFTCPHAYYQKHIKARKITGKKVEEGYVDLVSKAYFDKGKYCHKVFELYMENKKQDIYAIAQREVIKFGLSFDDFIDCKDVFHNFLKRPYQKFTVIETEKTFKTILPNGVPVRATIDLLAQIDKRTLAIIDYKTGAKALYQMDADKSFQGKLYAWIIKDLFGDEYSRFKFILDPTKFKECFVVKVDDDWLYGVDEWMEIAYTEMNKRDKEADFKPKCGSHCSTCEVYTACPLMKDLSKLGANPVKRIDSKNVKKVLKTYQEVLGYKAAIEKTAEEYKNTITHYVDSVSPGFLQEKWGYVSIKNNRIKINLK